MAVVKIDRLTRREREIVNVLFALGNSASVEDIRSRLDDPPGESSVRGLRARLEEKGVVRRQQAGVRNIYSATIPAATARRNALRQYVQTFFGGSRRLLLTSLVRDGSWTDQDLEAVREEIDRVRRKGGSRDRAPRRRRTPD